MSLQADLTRWAEAREKQLVHDLGHGGRSSYTHGEAGTALLRRAARVAEAAEVILPLIDVYVERCGAQYDELDRAQDALQKALNAA